MHSLTRNAQDQKVSLTRSLATRGVVAVAFGIVMLVWPGPTLVALTYVFGAMAAVDGVLAIRAALADSGRDDRWWLGFTGIAGVVAAITVFVWPELTAVALLYLVGAWALVVGGMELAGAFFGSTSGSRRHFLALHGAISVAFGVVMWARPGAGALVLIALIAALAIARGVALCGMAYHLRRPDDAVAPADRTTAHAAAA